MTEQRTDEWFAARLGKVTASRIADVMAKTKSGPSASRANYLAQLLTERLTGKPTEGFSSAAMDWGTEQEPYARAAYSAKTGELVEEVGFIDHASIKDSGASPDGRVGGSGEGLVEIKCPNTATHLEWIFDGKPPQKYVLQMQWQMACTGTKWCDFVSYDPRLPDRYQLFVNRIPRDDALIAIIEAEVKAFLEELTQKIVKLETMEL